MNTILDQSVIILAGYLAVFVCFVRAIWHRFAYREYRDELREGEEELALLTAQEISPSPDSQEWLANPHPAAAAALHVHQLPGNRQVTEDVSTYFTHRRIAPLINACDANQGLAACLGFVGTLLGLMNGAFIYAASQNKAGMLSAIALALGTTLAGAITREIELWNMRAIIAWAEDLEFQTRCWITRITEPFPDRVQEHPEPAILTTHPPAA